MVTQERREGEPFDSLLRKFKRRVKAEGTLQDFRKREFYEKPSEARIRQGKAAKLRTVIQQREEE